MDDELNSEAGADIVIDSDQKPLRGNASPESCLRTAKKADFFDPDQPPSS